MERNIKVNGTDHIIKGQWVIDGMRTVFMGDTVNVSGLNKKVLPIEYSIPLTFQSRFGTAAMEDEIVESIKNHLEKKS